jgi:diphosphomevalonate decarboxylase
VKASAVAHPNIALAKYWGKQAAAGNYPAVPSLSLTLSGMSTRTEVAFDDGLDTDVLLLDGVPADARALERAVLMLDRVRAASGVTRSARVTSANDFPTASGLASSASGFAALALASTRAAGLDWDAARVSDLARQSSASAARSLFGGFVALESPLAHAGMVLPAVPIAPESHLDVVMLVCVTTERTKDVSSTDGMQKTAERSPYYRAWLDEAPRTFVALRDALLAKDLERVGVLTEASALAMHACALAAGVTYFTGATLLALEAVRTLRSAGRAAWATVDAGPHVKVLCGRSDAEAVRIAMAAVPGVIRVIETRPGPGASVVCPSGGEA